MLSPVHPIKRYMILISLLVSCDVNFDLLVRVVSATFLHCKVAGFPFVMSILWRDTLK